MNKLELTLIGMAQQQLSAVLRFHAKHEARTVTEDDEDEYLRDSGALSALLELGHLSDSGMGEAAVTAMLEVEAKHSAAVRAAHPLAKAAEAMSKKFPPRYVTGIQDSQTLRAADPDGPNS
ncbi:MULTISPECIES: hypothetical protein [Pseudomonas]|uniref:hypothetical protein n=1 Tax=Pseudomonas TaxID=286 RepID=UPI00084AD826|nr:hypothetical protein [Pseudomonas sp. AP19]OEC63283.1 hypothetical protein A7D21_28825 [Pseudomonas sp. AP19]